MEIKYLQRCEVKDANGKVEPQRLLLFENVYPDGRFFHFQYDHSMDVKPSLRDVLCTIGVNNKKPTPKAWDDEAVVSWESYLPLKPHYARKQNFYKNPRKCAVVKFEFNPKIIWKKYPHLVGAMWELYIQIHHPKLWNNPKISFGFGTEDQQGNFEHISTIPKLSESSAPISETLH